MRLIIQHQVISLTSKSTSRVEELVREIPLCGVQILTVSLASELQVGRYKTVPELSCNFLSFSCDSSGGRARPEAARCGRGTAAQDERETAFLRGGLPA